MADTATERPLDDRLGEGGPRWKISVVYVDHDGKETSDRAEVRVREYEKSLRIANTPDLVVEMEAGRLARNVLRARSKPR